VTDAAVLLLALRRTSWPQRRAAVGHC